MKWLKFILIPIIMATLLPTLTMAEEKIYIYIGGPGKNKIPVALPKPVSSSKASVEFFEVLKNDLELSGWVEIVDPKTYIEPPNVGIRPGNFRYQDWEITGAAGLAKTKFEIKDNNIRSEVWVYDVAGRKKIGAKAFSAKPERLRTLAHKAANEIIVQLTGKNAPFNTRFAYIGSQTGNKELYIMDFDGENKMRITRNGKINIKPSWNRNGDKISFTSYLNGNPDLYIADLSKGKISRLSARRGVNIGASWSPTNLDIILTLAPNGNSDIYKINAQTGRIIQRLTKSYGIDTAPVYSPDGSKIAYVSERSGGAQIYIMDADGSNHKRLTFQGSQNTDPDFSPDGSTLAFVSRDQNFDIFTSTSTVLDSAGSPKTRAITKILHGALTGITSPFRLPEPGHRIFGYLQRMVFTKPN
ncbi:MAG: hypothetical protein VX278_10325 [Myxococcota bacterium]|nr:hypothetical protein [Myxococcota bacterium]